MSKKSIQADLENSLLGSTPFSATLYKHILLDFDDDMTASLQADSDDALICLVAENNEVAMMLVERNGSILQNEAARDRLQQMWKHNYTPNVRKFLPIFVENLRQGMLAVTGIKWV